MPTEVFHLTKLSLGLKRKYRITTPEGPAVAWADKRVGLSDELGICADEQRTDRVVTIRGSSQGWLAGLTGFEAFDREERLLGSFAKYALDFVLDGVTVLSIEKPKALTDVYVITVRHDQLDRQLVLALAVTLEARQH